MAHVAQLLVSRKAAGSKTKLNAHRPQAVLGGEGARASSEVINGPLGSSRHCEISLQ